MPDIKIFISHATADDAFVKQLREVLEGLRLPVWVDSRELRGGAKLEPEIVAAIENARQFVVVLSPHTINSAWVQKEIKLAQKVERRRKGDGYRVIPILLDGIDPAALPLWFKPVPSAILVRDGSLQSVMPQILAALGEQLPDDIQSFATVAAQPVAELLLELRDLVIDVNELGEQRVVGTAELRYQPADKNVREVASRRYQFRAPLGPIEADELRWYLERYYLWPVGVFAERAREVERRLPEWGQQLYTAALGSNTAQEALGAWRGVPKGTERRFSVRVDAEPPDGASEEQRAFANLAASALLALPWELLHDGRGFVFQGQHAARVRRRLPNFYSLPVLATALPIRVLLVSPRPEDERAGYIDHRASALPLVEAVEGLGELVALSVLEPPTFPALQEALERAAAAGQPFDVVHFDGHGVYDREHGLGALVFENPNDAGKLERRRSELVDATKLAETIRDLRIPLMFLDACQTARVEDDPTASVAAKLLEGGVASVVAMSHSVLVETARRFVRAFYAELARGARVGAAMLAGQRALHADTYRGKIMGAGELRLQDWFVPVLYQEADDPQLIRQLPPGEVQRLAERRRGLSLGALPDAPAHHFQGRSRELLALERLLARERYAVVRGQGGAGKTTLAAELARWLIRLGRFERAAFVSVEYVTDARAVLDSLGRQLLPEADGYSVARYGSMKEALQPVERALRDAPTLIVLDNLESVLPGPGEQSAAAAPIGALLELCQALLGASPTTRIVFTSREWLPAPFDKIGVQIGALGQADAIELVSQVMAQENWTPPPSDPGADPQEVADLVEAVNRHARALVLLAREVARAGVRATTTNLHSLMANLEREHPGERENSLFASVELSLRRLPAEMRAQIGGMGVFQGGANLGVIMPVLEMDEDRVRNVALALSDVGLAEDMGYGYLRLDPALPGYLLRSLSAEAQDAARARWALAMQQLVRFLFQQVFKDAQLAFQLTLLELPNLLALLEWLSVNAIPEQVVDIAVRIETLFAQLGRPQALAAVVHVREIAAQVLSKWNHAHFQAADKTFDRLLDQGNIQGAYELAQDLLHQCLSAGENAYPGASYDIATAYFNIGRALRYGGAAEAALEPLGQARRRVQVLAGTGNIHAERMAALAITETGDCLQDLGRLNEAADIYEESIKRSKKLDNTRQIAVNKGNLATVRLRQQRYDEALRAYAEARDTFAGLGEPRSVAIAWHQIGIVHRLAGQLEQAERAHQQSLSIWVQQQDLAGQAGTLVELGNLYGTIGHPEESVKFLRQAADIYTRLQNLRHEGVARSNLAIQLIMLRRYGEARRELQHAIECKRLYGHTTELWKTWDILHGLEKSIGNTEAAAAARSEAIASYLTYRRAGGESQSHGAQWCTATAQLIKKGQADTGIKELAQLLKPDSPGWARALIPVLQSILAGSRDQALAEDPALHYTDAAEVRLLLEKLNGEGAE